MKISLADTSIRQYRKRNGAVAFHLRSYLMIETTAGFRLSAYLRSISGRLTLSSGVVVPLDEIMFSEDCRYRLGVMVHDFWASGTAPMELIRDDTGILRIDYHISFTGHTSEEPAFLEALVPVVSRGSVRDRLHGSEH